MENHANNETEESDQLANLDERATIKMEKRWQVSYHAIMVAWYLFVNLQLAVISISLLTERLDAVKGQFGCGLQYLTMWNLILHNLYFSYSLGEDLLPDDYKHKELCQKLLTVFFHCAIFPITISVAIVFWLTYHIDPSLLDQFGVLDTIMKPTNHSLHTMIVPAVIFEMFFAERPKSHINVMDLFRTGTAFFYLYASIIFTFNYLSGEWPYPFLGTISVPLLMFLAHLHLMAAVIIWKCTCWIKDIVSPSNDIDKLTKDLQLKAE